MTRRNKRIAGFLAAIALAVAGLGYVGLRTQSPSASAAEAGLLRVQQPGTSATASPTPVPADAAAKRLAEKVARTKKVLTARANKARATKPKPAPTTTPTTAPTSPAPTAPGTAKKGAATWNQDGISASLKDSGVSWFYNWAPDPQGIPAPAGVEFVPMIWGADAVNESTLATAKSNGDTLLGFNEPDLGEQSNMTVERALELWPQLQKTGLRLGSPAVAWGADQNGQWLDRFMKGADSKGYKVDFITLHWYGSDFNPKNATSQLKSYVEATYAKYRKPIWLTEYSLMNFGSGPKFASPADQAEFVRLSTEMLESLDYVEHYSWFAFPTSKNGQDETGLYRPGGAITEPGKAYRSAGS
ncbi:hypothetical protein Kisp01_17390 [Kineosporia sp. NBRC 101677]|uniref:glycoside hydrolase family protein n=1 Tax=Kineosporia sp. NBRC 101677 TaxID=3032197 RepID=UPI0024A1FD25|nr:glycoside hydrolase family protein [Kineosporia sp. NBRC 101677]GLY14724.1 hypothetical protein Kisp01_17390 [Kineosporia sp. NBRC 101677]